MQDGRIHPLPAPRLPPPPPPEDPPVPRWGLWDTVVFSGVAILVLLFAAFVIAVASTGALTTPIPAEPPPPVIRIDLRICDDRCLRGASWVQVDGHGGISCRCL